MGPLALDWYGEHVGARDALASAQHFLVDAQMVQTAISVAVKQDEPWLFSWDMPAPTVCVEMRDCISLIYGTDDGKVSVFIKLNGAPACAHVKTHRGSNEFSVGANCDSIIQALDSAATSWREEFVIHAMKLDALLSLIAEPRLIQRKQPPRHHKRQAQRVLGSTGLPAWHTLSWTIGETIRPKCDIGDEDWRAPLHFSRAHWRRASESDPSSQLRRDAPGWWTWVKHSWKGHPDFGVSLKRYNPKLDPAGNAAATLAARDAAIAAWEQDRAQKSLKGANHA